MSLVYQQEALKSCLDEAKSLGEEQWAFTGDNALPYLPNWPLYLTLEQHGLLYLVVARQNDRAIGYALGFTHPHVNSQATQVATIPSYFVEECPMRGWIMKDLLQKAVAYFKAQGVFRVYVETEYQHSAGKLLERMGFEPIKLGYMLRSQGEGACAQTSESAKH